MNEVFLKLFLTTSCLYFTSRLYGWFGKIVSYFFSDISYIKLTYFELILYELIKNSRVFKEVECEPRKE